MSRVCGDYYKTGIGLTTVFIGSHTVTVYTLLQLTTTDSLPLTTSDPTLQPLLQPALMASLAITH
jgi:hypothetical protein